MYRDLEDGYRVWVIRIIEKELGNDLGKFFGSFEMWRVFVFVLGWIDLDYWL